MGGYSEVGECDSSILESACGLVREVKVRSSKIKPRLRAEWKRMRISMIAHATSFSIDSMKNVEAELQRRLWGFTQF